MTSDLPLQKILAPYQSPQHSVVGFTLVAGESSYHASGPQLDGVAPQDQIYEIGSITKVFTGLLMSLQAEDGALDPAAPLHHLSPELRGTPDWITPQTLSAHISGLPNLHMPIWRAALRDFTNGPYADFSRADLLDWLRAYRAQPAHPRHAYSNLGAGLLGEAMAMQQGQPYPTLLTQQVLTPMGMTDTGYPVSDDQQARFMSPKDTKGHAVTPWDWQALAGAGCLRSSARDLTRFASHVIAAMHSPVSALDRAMQRAARPVFGLGRGGRMWPQAQGAGWRIIQMGKTAPRMLFHNGATAGSSCALFICPAKSAALGVLSNNGVAGNLWGSLRLERSDPITQAQRFFVSL